MKKCNLKSKKMNYNISIRSQHKEVLGVQSGVRWAKGLVVTAMDRLIDNVSRRKQVQDVGAGQGLVYAHFAREHRKCS